MSASKNNHQILISKVVEKNAFLASRCMLLMDRWKFAKIVDSKPKSLGSRPPPLMGDLWHSTTMNPALATNFLDKNQPNDGFKLFFFVVDESDEFGFTRKTCASFAIFFVYKNIFWINFYVQGHAFKLRFRRNRSAASGRLNLLKESDVYRDFNGIHYRIDKSFHQSSFAQV